MSHSQANLFPNEPLHENIKLDLEDKMRIFKGVFLIFLYSSVVISSMVYYNSPNYNPNLIFEGPHDRDIKNDKHSHNNPVYRLQSRFTGSDFIELNLKLERVGRYQSLDSEIISNLRLRVKFSKNRANLQVSSLDSDIFSIPKFLYDTQDLELELDSNINNISESNIGIHIINHPFSFYLYRKETGEKLFDTTHSRNSENPDHYFFYSRNYLMISTKLPKGHFTYGLGERFTKMRLDKGKYLFYAADRNQGAPIDKETETNSYSSIPFYLTINPESLNSNGVYMMNSSPMEITLEDEYLTYKLTSGIIDLYIFNGPRPKEVIMQIQKTFGTPFLPDFSALNWHANVITNQPLQDFIAVNRTFTESLFNYTFQDIWIDYSQPVDSNTYKDIDLYLKYLTGNGYRINCYKRSPIAKTSVAFAFARDLCIRKDNGDILYGKTSYGEVCFIDYLKSNALSFITKAFINEPEYSYNKYSVNLLLNEPSQNCNGECISQPGNESKISVNLPFLPGEERTYSLEMGTLPLSIKQSKDGDNTKSPYSNNTYRLLDTHNLYSLQETQTYYHALIDYGIKRPLIFSRSVFFGNQQYSGKWLGYIESSWKGLKMAIIQTINFNIYGNPNTIHEACGFSRFSAYPAEKIKLKDNQELCVRWLQYSSINPFARLNDFEIIPYYSDANRKAIEATFALRAEFLVYLYGNMIKNAVNGGSLIRPMFMDFRSEKYKNEIHSIDSQMMVGSALLASPVIISNERMKMTFFPSDLFYDYYTGKIINLEGETFRFVDSPLNKLPLFIRSGYTIPIQKPLKNIRNLIEMRKQPIELVIALDKNYRSTGLLMLDDGISPQTAKYKEYFCIDITTVQEINNKNIEIIFRKTDNNFTLINEEFPFISNIKIYGIPLRPYRVFYQSFQGGRTNVREYSQNSIEYDNLISSLNLKNINTSLHQEDSYKIILEFEWSK